MALTTRQNNLLAAEDWKKIYQTFRNADFSSYDFETLRKSMIDYLRTYYPEDFNDYIESSEFVALIDLIAWLGQNLAFRTDLNARENFIDTAERRDSVLKLARLVSYTPKRNIAASGFLKITSVSTTEAVYDSAGINLSNISVTWNDASNDNWLEQFAAILNATLANSQIIGKPGNSKTINNIKTDEYSISIPASIIPVFKFQALVNDVSVPFEFVSATSVDQPYVYEKAPGTSRLFNIVYRNDNQGNASNNTGFFLYFKQGDLQTLNFNLTDAIPNRKVQVNFDNINNSDVWLYEVETTGALGEEWKSAPNVIYNKSANKKIYQINTRNNDQIDLVFGDGSFAQVPTGNYQLFYRTSNGLNYKIAPNEMQGITCEISYVSRVGRIETLRITASLQYTVANSSTRESLAEIRQRAPQQYYTQNRMITGEDYNLFPFTNYNNILKIKAVNRTSSGISRYLDISDPTGKYSSTNIFGQDGYLYKESYVSSFSFSFATIADINRAIYNQFLTKIVEKPVQHFFYANSPRFTIANIEWHKGSTVTNGCTGYFKDQLGMARSVPGNPGTNLRYVTEGAIIKFMSPPGQYFDAGNRLITGTPRGPNDRTIIYATVVKILGDGANNGRGLFSNGTGPVILNQNIPGAAIIAQIIPVFKNNFSASLIASIIDEIQLYRTFGLRYDVDSASWQLITASNLNTAGSFSTENAGNNSNLNLDASWYMYAQYTGTNYEVKCRALDYVFESVKETQFYFDPAVRIYDPVTATTINDQIKILRHNRRADNDEPLGKDCTWYIYKNVLEADGWANPNKILVTFPDSDLDGIPDDPDVFNFIVEPAVNSVEKLVFFQLVSGYNNFLQVVPIDSNQVIIRHNTKSEIETNLALYDVDQLFYASSENKFYTLSITNSQRQLAETSAYVARTGRQNLVFQYRHNSPNNRRIDPSPSNAIDLYILTKSYANDFLAWVRDASNSVELPEPPDSVSLSRDFGDLENYKAVSDSLIYNSAKFKLIIGDKADPALRAIFKVVKNPGSNISDNDIKTNLIEAVNNFFSLENWEFGETFYFSDLSAYLHKVLAPSIASVVIVPSDTAKSFGNLYQINAEANEIIQSAATVDNVMVISALTAAQLNQTTSGI